MYIATMITESSIIEMADGLSVADLDGEAVILNKRSCQYHGFNESGARILTLLNRPMPVSAILEQMLELYDIEQGQLKKDLLAFLEGLLNRRLIKVKNETSTQESHVPLGGTSAC